MLFECGDVGDVMVCVFVVLVLFLFRVDVLVLLFFVDVCEDVL